MGGIICEATVEKNDPNHDRLKTIKLKTLDGEAFDIHKTYKVVTNAYMASVCKPYISQEGRSLNTQTAEYVTRFLEKKQHVNYQQTNRLFFSFAIG